MTQPTVILVLKLCLQAHHFVKEVPKLISHRRKAIVYIGYMAETSMSAYSAWKIFRGLLTNVSQRYDNLDVLDVLE